MRNIFDDKPIDVQQESRCMFCGWDKFKYTSTRASNGAIYVKKICELCGRRFDGKTWVKCPPGLSPDDIPIDEDYCQEFNYTCEVCGKKGAEIHHWAPRGLFGDEADDWPVSLLCRECHMKWHNRIITVRRKVIELIHIGFTIDADNTAHIIIKDSQRHIIHHSQVPLGESRGEVAEWLACKAALREAGRFGSQAVRLYSDCQVVERLKNLDPAYQPGQVTWPTGYGRLPDCQDPALYHYFDTLNLLWTLFNGKWEAIQVEKERILNGNRIPN